jgi:predicted RNase H-like HicB family nuclease
MSTKKSRKTMEMLERGYHALVWKEGGWYVARGVEVEVASQGKTKQAAVENLKEALNLWKAF